VHGLEVEYYDQINFVYLDIDDPANDTFKQDLGFRYQPHLFVLDGVGEILYQWIGPISQEEFIVAFEDVLSQ
jgi:hypothetical protein